MTILRTENEYQSLRSAGNIVARVLDLAESIVKAGISTAYIDRTMETYIRDNGATPAFKGYKGYPSCICASINSVVVHGLPSEKIVLEEGDIIGVDVGVKKNGFFADAARTFKVGNVSEKAQKLITATRISLERGIKKAIAGNRISDISRAVQDTAREYSFKEVRSFVGHGIGRNLHEAPEVPNWVTGNKGNVMEKGLVLAIEPMFNMGCRDVKIMADGWTAVTGDNELSAHFEHTVVVGINEPEVIT